MVIEQPARKRRRTADNMQLSTKSPVLPTSVNKNLVRVTPSTTENVDDELDYDSDDGINMEHAKEVDGVSREPMTTILSAFLKKTKIGSLKELPYDFSEKRRQIRDVSGSTGAELTHGRVYRHQKALLHQIIRNRFVNNDNDLIDVVFQYGGYGSGIIFVNVKVYKGDKLEDHRRMARDKPDEIPADFVRDLWLLCMSRKSRMEKSKSAMAEGAVDSGKSDSSSSEQEMEKTQRRRLNGKCKQNAHERTDKPSAQFGRTRSVSNEITRPTRTALPKRRHSVTGDDTAEHQGRLSHCMRNSEPDALSDSSNSTASSEAKPSSPDDSGISDAVESATDSDDVRCELSDDAAVPTVSLKKASGTTEVEKPSEPDIKKELDTAPGDFNDLGGCQGLTVKAIFKNHKKPAIQPKRISLIENDKTRRLREEVSSASYGVKYDDFYDPTTGTLLWFSQSCDTSSQVCLALMEHFRRGLADIVLAAKSASTRNQWTLLGTPIDVRLHSIASLKIKRGDRIVRTWRKNTKAGHLKIHVPSTMSKTARPLCADVAGRTFVGMSHIHDTYDGLDQTDLDERARKTSNVNMDKKRRSLRAAPPQCSLSEHRMVTTSRESKYTPSDCCIYCGWEPAALWFTIAANDRKDVEGVFLGKSQIQPKLSLKRRASSTSDIQTQNNPNKRTDTLVKWLDGAKQKKKEINQ